MAKVPMMMITLMITAMTMMVRAMMMMMITAGLDTGAGLCNIHSTSQQLTGIKGTLTNFDDDDLVPF